MDWKTVVDILAIIVALLTLLINIVVSQIVTRKNNYLKIAATHRTENLNYARKLTSDILTYSNIEYIKSNRNDKLFIQTKEELYYYYKGGTHIEEAELQIAIEDLSDAYFAYCSDNTKCDDLILKRNRFFVLSKIFELAYWTFLKDHANGKKHETHEFESIYDKIRSQYIARGYDIKERGKLYDISRYPQTKKI